MAQQTAVQFLEPLLIEKIHALSLKRRHEIISLIQQAKLMEEERLINAYIASLKAVSLYPLDDSIYRPDAEQYYNETYGGSK